MTARSDMQKTLLSECQTAAAQREADFLRRLRDAESHAKRLERQLDELRAASGGERAGNTVQSSESSLSVRFARPLTDNRADGRADGRINRKGPRTPTHPSSLRPSPSPAPDSSSGSHHELDYVTLLHTVAGLEEENQWLTQCLARAREQQRTDDPNYDGRGIQWR